MIVSNLQTGLEHLLHVLPKAQAPSFETLLTGTLCSLCDHLVRACFLAGLSIKALASGLSRPRDPRSQFNSGPNTALFFYFKVPRPLGQRLLHT